MSLLAFWQLQSTLFIFPILYLSNFSLSETEVPKSQSVEYSLFWTFRCFEQDSQSLDDSMIESLNEWLIDWLFDWLIDVTDHEILSPLTIQWLND